MQLEQHIMERERKAEEKGVAKGIEGVAIKLLQNHIPVKTIQECTELSFQRLQELADNLGIELVNH